MSKYSKHLQHTYTNLAGGEAFEGSPKLQLVSLLLSSFLTPQYYSSETDQEQRLQSAVLALGDKRFAGRAAVYARNVFGMRSITHALIGILSHHVKDVSWLRPVVKDVIRRPDDALEIVSYILSRYGKPIPNAVKRGVRDAIVEFDEYALTKYKASGSKFGMVDLFNLVHPAPKNEAQADVFKRLIDGTLVGADTWEVGLSEAKSEAEKAAVWSHLLRENKLGYLALVRNLRNILMQADRETIQLAAERLVNPEVIKKSLVFPFQFQVAYEAVSGLINPHSDLILTAISKAMDISLDNVPSLSGETAVVLDISGSMGITGSFTKSPGDIGSVFAAAILKKNPSSDFVMFAERSALQEVERSNSIIDITKNILKLSRYGSGLGGGTDFSSIFSSLKKPYDRIIILSDMQSWRESYYGKKSANQMFKEYCAKREASPTVFSFDLQGYGSLQFPEKNIVCVSGFSSEVFKFMEAVETGIEQIVDDIMHYRRT